MKQQMPSNEEELKQAVIVGKALLQLTTVDNILLFVKTMPDGESIPAAILLDMLDTDLRAALVAKKAEETGSTVGFYSEEITKELNEFKLKLSTAIETLKMTVSFMTGLSVQKSHQRSDYRKSFSQQLLKVQTELKDRNKPHELGTVDQIAKRYNISKSEVRRHKAAGTLPEYLDTLTAVN